jgi:LysR family hydrogen peroxide-inducible transcriptional activator
VYDTTASASKKLKYKIKDIDISRLWLLEKSHCMTNQIAQICELKEQRTKNNNLLFQSSSILTLLNLIHENKGVTLLPKLATFQDNLIRKNYIHPLESPFPVREVGLAVHITYRKKRILNILTKRIKTAVESKLDTPKNVKVMKPF